MKPFRAHHIATIRILLAAVLVVAACVTAIIPFDGTAEGSEQTVAAATKQNESVTVTLPSYYLNGMVFQRGKPIMVKGELHNIDYSSIDWDEFAVTLLKGDKHYSGKLMKTREAAFTARIPKAPASCRPYTLKLSYQDRTLTTLNKVYVGDVFVAAGQSNMELNCKQYYEPFSADKDLAGSLHGTFTHKDLPETIDDANVHFIVARNESKTSQFPVVQENQTSWTDATKTNSQRLSYLAQFFARELRESSPNVPIGIIQTAWGGTLINRHIKGGDIYASHIATLQGYHVAGVLWYQGCNDAITNADALAYESQLTALINQYRKVFDDKELPFLYVQLARWPGHQYTQIVRQAQLSALDNPNLNNTDNVGMTVSIDTDKGTSATIHPLGKEILAKRMADQWKAMRGKKTVPSGPIGASASRSKSDGSIIVSFKQGTAQGLQSMKPDYSLRASASKVASPTDTPLDGFEVACRSGVFSAASARIDGDHLVITSDKIGNISQVRYLWQGNPTSSSLLYNKQGLPASPFIATVR